MRLFVLAQRIIVDNSNSHYDTTPADSNNASPSTATKVEATTTADDDINDIFNDTKLYYDNVDSTSTASNRTGTNSSSKSTPKSTPTTTTTTNNSSTGTATRNLRRAPSRFAKLDSTTGASTNQQQQTPVNANNTSSSNNNNEPMIAATPTTSSTTSTETATTPDAADVAKAARKKKPATAPKVSFVCSTTFLYPTNNFSNTNKRTQLAMNAYSFYMQEQFAVVRKRAPTAPVRFVFFFLFSCSFSFFQNCCVFLLLTIVIVYDAGDGYCAKCCEAGNAFSHNLDFLFEFVSQIWFVIYDFRSSLESGHCWMLKQRNLTKTKQKSIASAITL
jgi:hypothetical protein